MKNEEIIDELIDIRSIRPASISVRLCKTSIPSENIKELASSIREHGLIQSITVRPLNGGFEIIAGHRRFYACKLLRWKKIPARVITFSDKDAFEIQLVENMQRMTMDPIEEAEAFRKYILDYGWGGVSQLAKVISKSEQYVSSRIQILKLPTDIIEQISQDRLKVSHALELKLLNEDKQRMVAREIISKRLSLRQVREIARHEKREYEYDGEDTKYDSTSDINDDHTHIHKQVKILKRTLLSLRISLSRLDSLIEEANEKLYEDKRVKITSILMGFRLEIHSMIDKNLRIISELRTDV
ncbi:MAG: ParB/RepB/Spo0J family partition protein [Nitrososphaeraceae archaeon]|nr:ParB/RepB/Spo0J family partition protein [Nitrososphaeraceae archaeon]